ncbi:MAG: hypothetical protein K5636_08770 [Bacteroidales bacterium]|nr:hypothetical protein [Bacteroidales bacterium]
MSVINIYNPKSPTRAFTFSAKEKDTETGFSVTSLRSVSSSSLSQCQTSLAWHSLIYSDTWAQTFGQKHRATLKKVK